MPLKYMRDLVILLTTVMGLVFSTVGFAQSEPVKLTKREENRLVKMADNYSGFYGSADSSCVLSAVKQLEEWSARKLSIQVIDLDGNSRQVEIQRYNWRGAKDAYLGRVLGWCSKAKHFNKTAEYLACVVHLDKNIQSSLPDTVLSFCQHDLDKSYYSAYYELLGFLYKHLNQPGDMLRSIALDIAAAGKAEEFIGRFESEREEIRKLHDSHRDEYGVYSFSAEALNEELDLILSLIQEVLERDQTE